MCSHITIHSPNFIVLKASVQVISHLLLTDPSLPIHNGASVFTEALLHI